MNHSSKLTAVSVIALLASGPALAAGADMSWTTCSAPARLQPDPNGRSFYVSNAGTDPTSCPTTGGYTFKTVQAALNCALGGDTIFVRAGTYTTTTSLSNKSFSRQVLVTPYPNEYPAFDVDVPSEWTPVFSFYNVTNLAIQGLVIQDYNGRNTEGIGIQARRVTNFKAYYNTVRYLGHHGILFSGSNISIVGNQIYSVSLTALNGGYWNDAISTDTGYLIPGDVVAARNLSIVGNDVHEVYGECVGVYWTDGATVRNNRIHNCWSVGVYVTSQNVVIDKNLIYQQDDSFNAPGQGIRYKGISLATEASTAPFYPNNIHITNNIILGVSQGVRFIHDRGPGPGTPESFANVVVAYNTFDKETIQVAKFDPPSTPPSGVNQFWGNAAVSDAPVWAEFDTYYTGYWNVGGNYKYQTSQLNGSSIMGWVNRDNFPTNSPNASDYKLTASSVLKSALVRSGQPVTVSDDYFCADRTAHTNNSAGAVE